MKRLEKRGTDTGIETILQHAMHLSQAVFPCQTMTLVLFATEQSTLRIRTVQTINSAYELVHQEAFLGMSAALSAALADDQALAQTVCQRLALAVPNPATLCFPLRAGENCLGVLIAHTGAGSPNEREIKALESIAVLVAWGLGNAIDAVVREREQIAFQLHDSVCQTLYAVNTFADLAQRTLGKNQDDAAEYTHEVMTLTQAAIENIQTIVDQLRLKTHK